MIAFNTPGDDARAIKCHAMNDHARMKTHLSITDGMALIRTKLANERTFLAYMRTFIGILAAGVGLIKFTGDSLFVGTGYAMAAVSPLIFVFGLYHFLKVKKIIYATMTEGRAAPFMKSNTSVQNKEGEL